VPLTLDEAARLVGYYSWAEGRLFEIAGGWVASSPEPEVKLLFDRHSQHHAWRAGQWWDRLPVLADTDRESLVCSPSPSVANAAGSLASLDQTVTRLAGLYRVALPRLTAAYERHLSVTNPPSDSALIRTLNLLAGDAGADWREGEVFLQKLLIDKESVRSAGETVARLELMLL